MAPQRSDPFLREVRLQPDREPDPDGEFPWNTDVVRALAERPLALHPRCTFLVGANGSGKSTLLEAIAVAAGLGVDGGGSGSRLDGREEEFMLGQALTLTRGGRRPRTDFFLRAESMLGLATRLEDLPPPPPGSRAGSIWESYGGKNLHHQSHGESFLAIINHRFGANGLYLLDEPESALSPQSLLALLARIADLLDQGCQFIVATHSPILLALPEAQIVEVTPDGLAPVDYDDVEAVRLTRLILADPGGMMARLLAD